MADIKVFSKEWFKKYNKWIVKLAKIPFIGEWVFCFKKYGHYFDIDNLLEVQPNAVVEDMKLMWTKCVRVNGQWVAYDCTNKLHNRLIKKECKEKLLPTRRNHYFVRNEYALRLQKVFYPIWITFHIWDIITRPIPQLNLGFDTLTVYPASGENSPCDGGAMRNYGYVTWDTVHDGNGTHANTSAVYLGIEAVAEYSTMRLQSSFQVGENKWAMITRVIVNFDTSSLPDSATISAATLSGYLDSKGNSFTTGAALGVTQPTPGGTNVVVDSDYNIANWSNTKLAKDISYADMTASQYNDFALNATGYGLISKTGVTSLGFRFACDIDDTPLTWQENKYTDYRIYSSDYGSNKPKLVVTYTLPVTFIPRTMWF